MNKTIRVGNKMYMLNEGDERLMQFVQESRAISKHGEIIIDVIRPQTFEFVKKVLIDAQYDIRPPPRVNTNVLEDLLDEPLVRAFKGIDVPYLNEVYRAAHFLKIPALRRCLAAVLASRVHFNQSLADYNLKKQELKIEGEVTHADVRVYHENYPFMN